MILFLQTLMNAVKTRMAVGRSAPTQLDHTYVAATMAIGLPLTYVHAMVLFMQMNIGGTDS